METRGRAHVEGMQAIISSANDRMIARNSIMIEKPCPPGCARRPCPPLVPALLCPPPLPARSCPPGCARRSCPPPMPALAMPAARARPGSARRPVPAACARPRSRALGAGVPALGWQCACMPLPCIFGIESDFPRRGPRPTEGGFDGAAPAAAVRAG